MLLFWEGVAEELALQCRFEAVRGFCVALELLREQ